ncbi:unnamed protein product [Closterium sp. NIES-54]
MVTTTTPGGQCVSICTCTQTGRHLASFTHRPGSSLYTLATEPPQVGASAQVSALGLVASPCSCRLLSHQTLLWHHRLGNPSLPRLRGMHSRLLVSGLPRSLPPDPPLPAPPCLPCVEGQQRAAPHSSFPPTTAPLHTLHMDVWGPPRVSGQGHERNFLLVVDDYTRYTMVFPLYRKGEVPDFLIPCIRALHLQLRERFRQDLPVLRLHSDRGGEFSSNLLRDFCCGEGILQSFTLSDSPQQNGITERRIGLVIKLNLWPRVSLLKTSPTLRWTGEVGDASVFRVWGSRAFVRDMFANKLSTGAIPCDVTFDESVPFYCLFPYRSAPLPPPPLFLDPSPPPVDPLPPQGHAPSGVSQVDPLPGTVPVEVGVDPGAARGAASGGAASGDAEPARVEPGGAEPEGAESEGAGSGGAEPGGAEPGGSEPAGAEPRGAKPEGAELKGAESEGAESGGAEPRGTASSGGPAAAGAGDSTAGGTRAEGVGATRLGGAGVTTRAGGTGGTGAAGTGGVGGAGAIGAGAGDPGAGGAGTGGTRFGGARAGGTGTGGAGAGAGDTGAVDPGARGAGTGGAVSRGTDARGTVQRCPFFIMPQPSSLLPPDSVLRQPDSPMPAPFAYAAQTYSFTEHREPESRPALLVRAIRTGRWVPRPRPPPLPGTHVMALRPSSVPLRVPLPPPPESYLPAVPDPESDLARASSPTVSRLLAIVVTDPSFESTAASALIVELVKFAAACRLDHATALVAESESNCPPSVGGECALGTNVLEDRQEEFECLAAAVPHLVVMLLAPEGDPDALDIPPPRSYAEAITAQRDYELHSLDFSTAFLQGSLHEGIWLRRPLGFTGSFPAGTQWSLQWPVYGLRQAPRKWHDTLRTTLAALGFAPLTADPSLFLRTDTSLPPFYVLVHTRYSSPSSTPLPTGHSLSAPPSDEFVELSGPYPELLGCLIHRLEHWEAAKRVLRYLCGTSGMGLVLGGRGPVVLTGHTDASWVDNLAMQRSSQGYTWRSTRSSLVLSSSCEAEIYAGAMAAQELRWLTYLLTDLGEQPRSPLVLYVDNKAMIALCQEHRLEHRTKHITLRYFLARELQQRGQLRLAYVATRANTSDIFTKALQSARAEPRRPNRAAPPWPSRATLLCPTCINSCSCSYCITATVPAAATATMATPSVLTFDAEGRPIKCEVWLDDLHLFLQITAKDDVSLYDHTSGAAPAPPTIADSTARSQWQTRDAHARLAVRSHLPLDEHEHFGQHKTAKELYDAVVARYSSPCHCCYRPSLTALSLPRPVRICHSS